MIEVHDGEPLEDGLEIHMVELPKAPLPDTDDDTALARWARFLGTADQGEREALAMSDPVLAKDNEVLKQLSADPEVQRLAQEREEAFLLYQFELETARREAREQGLEQGQRQLVLRLFLRRFGDVTDHVRARVEAASPEQLERWADAIFQAESLESLLRDG